ncbi:MAG: peptide chain release factor 1 [Candidatus Nomurabacteria bacterium]|nr:MAG: peptide chain release factor 1 [Candidatus Nomurabacteria bacterium]
MDTQLQQLRTRHQELAVQLQQPELMQNPDKLRTLSKEFAELSEVVNLADQLDQVHSSLTQTQESLKDEQDPEMLALGEEEIAKLNAQRDELQQKLNAELNPPDPLDKKDVIVEIRAGAGGDEAALFAAELFRAYARYAEEHDWSTTLLSMSRIGIGGIKEVVFEMNGTNVYRDMKYEAGVHRVQRVPETEKSGRVHTSTITVAVMPEAEEKDFEIKPEEVRIEATTAGGHGGQSVNTTYSAIRLHHIPTGLIVVCQDERSQKQNKEKAFRVLRARLFALEQERRQKEASETRKSQVGSGDRSEKIRTYNFPQDRVTDHRINQNFSNLKVIMDGGFDPIIQAIQAKAQQANNS